MKNENADKAIEKYYEFKKKFPGSYGFQDVGHLIKIGNWLLSKKRSEDFLEISKFMVKEFPKYWYSYYRLGDVYMRDGIRKLAIKNFKKVLTLKPNTVSFIKKTKEKLKELRK